MLTLAKTLRGLLIFAAALLVLWSIVDVGARVFRDLEPGQDKITLTILHWGSAEENAIVDQLVNQFQSHHPRIRIQNLSTTSNEYRSKLKTMLSADTPPDLFYLPAESVPDFAGMGLLTNLDPHIKKEKAAGQGQWLDDFYPMLLSAFRYDGHTIGKGPLYGLPKDFTTMLMYINVDLFQRAGVTPPYNGWTWKQYQADMKKIAALTDPNSRTGPIYGGVLNTYTGVLRDLVWSYGGYFFANEGSDFTQPTFDSPPVQAALKMIYHTRFIDRSVYNATGIAKSPGQLFISGKIGCIGPVGRWVVPVYRGITDFHWDVVPLPHRAGVKPVTTVATVAWTISKQTAHPKQAYELLKFLCGPKGQTMSAKLGLAIPSLKSVANSDAFLSPGRPPLHTPLFLKLIPQTRVAQLPRLAKFSDIVNDEVSQAVQLGLQSTQAAAKHIKTRWLNQLHSPLNNQKFSPMRWAIIGWICLGVLVCVVTLTWWRMKRIPMGALDRRQERAGWLFISPWVIGFAAFTIGPMILSLVLAFTAWTAMTPIWNAKFVGLANFQYLFQVDPTFLKSLEVTIYYAILAVPLGQAAALAVAMLMARDVRAINIFRTIFFIPSIITGVALATLWLSLFNTDYGLLNAILRPICHLLGTHPPDWFGRDANIWAVPAFVIMSLWGVGGGMIIYLAALKGVPQTLYEAARIDGAGHWRQFWNVTLPMISPLVFFNLVMGIIASFQVFTQAYVMTHGGPGNATLFYVLNLYEQAFELHNMGYASAMAWVLFLILVLLTALVIRSSRSWVHYEGLKT